MAATVVALALGLALACAAACSRRTPAPHGAVRVAAASDLRFALDEILESFRTAHPDVAVTVTYGSSGNFFAQLVNGAPFDVFLSADIDYPRQLAARRLIVDDRESIG